MLDDVSCLLHILIHGKLVNHMAKISQEQGAALLIKLFGVIEDDVGGVSENMKGSHIVFS